MAFFQMNGWNVLSLCCPIAGMGLLASSYALFKFGQEQANRTVIPRPARPFPGPWPHSWLMVRARQLHAVQAALGLANPTPCSWEEGLAGEGVVFITRPVKGWVLLTGAALPDPTEDADACFRFVCAFSQRFGQTQLFCAIPILRHHAWIKAERGRVVRAYVWAGKTLWNQGDLTPEEQALGLKCFDYADDPELLLAQGQTDLLEANSERVMALAGLWSLGRLEFEPLLEESHCGVCGEPSRIL